MKLYKTAHGTISFIDIYESFIGYYLERYANDNTIRFQCYCVDSVDIGYSFYHDADEEVEIGTYISYRI